VPPTISSRIVAFNRHQPHTRRHVIGRAVLVERRPSDAVRRASLMMSGRSFTTGRMNGATRT
jgi:hypothetical protein